MTYFTHINRNTINSNRKNEADEPAIRFQKGLYGTPTYAFEVELPSRSRVIYRPYGEPILPCGARLVTESDEEPKVIR